MFGPARSPTKAPYRSPVKSLALEVTAEPPIPPSVTDLCFHGQVLENITALVCGDATNPDCSGSIKGTFSAARRCRWGLFGLESRLSYKNFPVEIRTTAGVNVTTISYPCDPAEWPTPGYAFEFFIETGAYRWDYALESLDGGDCSFRMPQFGNCSELAFCSVDEYAAPAFGELISARIQVASWGITSIAAPNVITVGFNDLWAGDHIAIKGTPGSANDRGFVEVTVDSVAGNIITVDASANLQAQGAGGTVELIVAGWARCVSYTDVGLPASDLYPAQLYAGPGDNFNDPDTAFIRLESAGVYDGEYQTIFKGLDKVELVGQNWITLQTTGAWYNNILQLTAPGHSVSSGTKDGRIVNSPSYDGEYTFEFVDADRLIVRDLWWVGGGTGTIQYRIVSGTGTGIDPGWSGPIAITVSGTTDYNGTWNVNAFNFGFAAFFTGGDFDTLWGISEQAGTWVEVGGLGRSGNITIQPNSGPDAITFFEPQRNGDIGRIDSDVMRIIAADSQGVVGGAVRLFSDTDPAPYAANERTIKLVTATYVEADGRFEVPDTGRLTVRDPY